MLPLVCYCLQINYDPLYRPDDTGGAAHSCAVGHTTCDKVSPVKFIYSIYVVLQNFSTFYSTFLQTFSTELEAFYFGASNSVSQSVKVA